MNVSTKALSELPEFTVAAGSPGKTATGVYICDLLSWAMANVQEGDVWITVQGHVNMVAVAALTGAACVVLCEGASLDPDAAANANEQGVLLLSTPLNAYAAAKLLLGYDAP